MDLTDKTQLLNDLTKKPITSFLPTMRINQQSSINMNNQNCFILNNNVKYVQNSPTINIGNDYYHDTLSSQIINITTIDINTPETPTSICYEGGYRHLYVNQRAIYLMAESYENNNGVTHIHKFSLKNTFPVYRGSHTINGNVPGSHPAFMMNEYQDIFRIVTTQWSSQNHTLTLLKESGEADQLFLEVLSQLPNDNQPQSIGKPGERIYGVRFIKNRGYVVTFKKVDPLYVIDLSNPKQPFIAGQLEIPGFSSYIHPVNENLLFAIGKETKDMGSFAWYQGLKLALFDVSDANNPFEIEKIEIGKRGTESNALYDHHAVTLTQDSSTGITKLAIPVSLYDREPQYNYDGALNSWTHTGLYQFEITDGSKVAPGIKQQGKLIASAYPDLNYDHTSYDRSVMVGDSVHYIHKDEIYSATWLQPGSFTHTQ